MNPMTSAKAWTGGLTAALIYEYLNPVVAWLTTLASNGLDACCGAPMPEAAQSGLSALVVAVAVGAVVHLVPNLRPSPK